MKILYVTDGIYPYVIGGMQVVSSIHIHGLAKLGIELVVIHSRINSKVSSSMHFPGKVHTLPWPYLKNIKKYLPWHYSLELKKYSQQVKNICLQEKPDVIYSEGPLVSQLLKDRVSDTNNIPIIFHPHGLDMFQKQGSLIPALKMYMLRSIFKKHAQLSDIVISQGGLLTNILLNKLSVPKKKIAILPNSITYSLSNITPKQKKHIPLKLLFVGRNDPKKGFNFLLNTLKDIHNISLDVIGFNREDKDNITYHGTIKDKNIIASFYKKNDILVLPSYSEGMATVLLEAMSYGMPCIATYIGASSELVIDNKTGWLIKPGRKDLLIEAIENAKNVSRNEYLTLSRNCINHIKENYISKMICKKLYNIIEKLCQK